MSVSVSDMPTPPVRVVLARVVRSFDNHHTNDRLFIELGNSPQGLRNAHLIVGGYLEQLTKPEPDVPATLRVFNPKQPVAAKSKTPVVTKSKTSAGR